MTAGVITGNVLSDNELAIGVGQRTARVAGNAIHGNQIGVRAFNTTGSVVLQGNNIFGNGCGVNTDAPGLLAANHYWGAPSGPGSNPADDVCGTEAGSAIVAPFATQPFKVSAPILISNTGDE